jgi:hypothetical protein
MTQKIADIFNIGSVEPTTDLVEPTIVDDSVVNSTTETFSLTEYAELSLDLDKIDAALPAIRDLEATDRELDELATLAKDKFNDLIELGMNVEPRISGTIFQTAGVLLGHAITAKQTKIDKKLRIIALQIQKARLDQNKKTAVPVEDTEEIEGKATVMDRNSLLRTILADMKNLQK